MLKGFPMNLELRFHGRGGQGIKTAAQIVGSAAFFSGYQAQDFPLYGAERRGAPIVAFTRISEHPIQERGPITQPNILMVGDPTLLNDPQAAPLCGIDENAIVFINTKENEEALKKRFSLLHALITLNFTDLCISFLGKANIISSALAAAAAKITQKISIENLHAAIETELEDQGFSSDLVQKNLQLSDEIFNKTPILPIKPREEHAIQPNKLIKLGQQSVVDAAPIILSHSNMDLRKTGNWRLNRPVIEKEKCSHCLLCYARCPEGVIAIDDRGEPSIDYEHCKGCMICAQECPLRIIKTVKEEDLENGHT